MSQPAPAQGLKHAHTEPSRLDGKRERVRGATRAMALRRVPSDSDCSAETASLSADSGDRVNKPAPPKTKTRGSRRRGSEWEVLEGLKDGQRFDKRPDVFNGYLHKKRKWPLKGWHKRFFVIDGGILVYARSPADVARGRLHGSVDVGLSVISAKARRRRIDIDADEFIYHLRAKTMDCFRAWLHLLNKHRLYRQHLLTFGARESVPKIHPPSDDIPATDNSSRTFQNSLSQETFSTVSSKNIRRKGSLIYKKNKDAFQMINSPQTCLSDSHTRDKRRSSPLLPLSFESFNGDEILDLNLRTPRDNQSLCSMNCLENIYKNDYEEIRKNKSPNIALEEQVLNTYLDRFSLLKNNDSERINDDALPHGDDSYDNIDINQRRPLFLNRKQKSTTAFYFFTNRKQFDVNKSKLKKSKKSTNLVKYKNLYVEPKLRLPFSQCVLGKYKSVPPYRSLGVACDSINTENNETQVHFEHVDKSIQNMPTTSEFDRITEKLMMSVFQNTNVGERHTLTAYVNQIVRELLGSKNIEKEISPMKSLFRSLLEYWLQNTAMETFRFAMKITKSVDKQSNKHFTKDEILSNLCVESVAKQTQFHGISDCLAHMKPANGNTNYGIDNSVEIDKRVQELENLLSSTVYVCDNLRSCPNRDKDIEITRTLIKNLNKVSENTSKNSDDKCDSSSSSELPKIQETLRRLISDTVIAPDIAKYFLDAYLGVLEDESMTDTSEAVTDTSKSSTQVPKVEVISEAKDKKLSRSVTTFDCKVENKVNNHIIDPGQVYLKEVLDNMTSALQNKPNEIPEDVSKRATSDKEEKPKILPESPERSVAAKQLKDNVLVINLSNYDLENVSMHADPSADDVITITVKLKGKKPNSEDLAIPAKNPSEKNNIIGPNLTDTDWLHKTNSSEDTSEHYFVPKDKNPLKIPRLINLDNQVGEELKHVSESHATCKEVDESKPLLDYSFGSSKMYRMQYEHSDMSNTKNQCYMCSLNKRSFANKFQFKKKVKVKEEKCVDISPSDNTKLVMIDRPAPNVIDERFILILLENLTILSQNTSLNKDITGLYCKLKKKHEKALKDKANVQGLSLLGKIYSSDLATGLRIQRETETQFEDMYEPKLTLTTTSANNCECADEMKMRAEVRKMVDEMTRNRLAADKSKKHIEKSMSAYVLLKPLTNCQIQTDRTKPSDIRIDQGTSPRNALIGSIMQTSLTSIPSDNDASVCKSWSRNSENRIQAVRNIQYLNSSQNMRVTKRRKRNDEQTKIIWIKNKDWVNEISIVSPRRKASVQSQTDKSLAKFMKDNNCINRYEVYRVVLKREKKSSMSDVVINLREKSDDLKTIYRCTSYPSYCSEVISARGPQAGFVSGTPGGRLAGWIIEGAGPLETASRELGQAQLSVQQLQRLLDSLDMHLQLHHDTDVSVEGASPNVKKDRRKFGLRKKKSSSKCGSVDLAPPAPHLQDVSNSHMALSTLTAPPSPGGGASSIPNSAASLPIACAATRPQSLPGTEGPGGGGPASITSLTPDHQLREDFTVLAKDLVASLKTVVTTLVCERSRLSAALEVEGSGAGGSVQALRTNLSNALQQNSELRSRLSRIHLASDLTDTSSQNHVNSSQQFQQSLSYSSSCVSASEFFDAEEHDEDEVKELPIIPPDEPGVIELDGGDSSSEAGSLSSEDRSNSSDNSDNAMVTALEPAPAARWTRRSRLPAPRPTPGGPSLWNLLYKNIGKDLSQISMPVTINEPLNMLQRLCEELEYSELLDAAAEASSAEERAALVASFAVSSYAAAASRAASKPFNPLLLETYECVRPDKQFKFLAEQVSHHPPISACHAESGRWSFWQEARIKTKFWGKSMEFQPTGRVHVRLHATGDHYTWNKVTTCVHNLFGGQRWVDQYGDMLITCNNSDLQCKLHFIKASSWSSGRHEVRGAISGGGAMVRVAGRWSEALYQGEPPHARCLWRPGALPPDHELYYGFTRFAMELNELEPGMPECLPPTDTRLRPDQRALEEGDVAAAERYKHELEQAQRERRRHQPDPQPRWFRKSYVDGEETWVFTGEYWAAREAGFPPLEPKLW